MRTTAHIDVVPEAFALARAVQATDDTEVTNAAGAVAALFWVIQQLEYDAAGFKNMPSAIAARANVLAGVMKWIAVGHPDAGMRCRQF